MPFFGEPDTLRSAVDRLSAAWYEYRHSTRPRRQTIALVWTADASSSRITNVASRASRMSNDSVSADRTMNPSRSFRPHASRREQLSSRQCRRIFFPPSKKCRERAKAYFAFDFALRRSARYRFIRSEIVFRCAAVNGRRVILVFALAALIQFGLALWLHPPLLVLLGVTWTYLVLMSKEFFVADWLKKRHVLYMVSHMAIVPLVDFYATACDWRPAGDHPPPGLFWFVAVSYFNGTPIP